MSLIIFSGPMWSGKTSKLIQEHKKWECLGKKTLVINHTIDNRYGSDEFLYSHDGIKIPCLLVNQLNEVSQALVEQADAILINEAQFFQDLKEKCIEWVELYDKRVYVAGLESDRYRQKFGQISDLSLLADEHLKLTAKCKICLDGTPAIFTFDQTCGVIDNQEKECCDSVEVDQIKVGYAQYMPLCRKHYLQLQKSF